MTGSYAELGFLWLLGLAGTKHGISRRIAALGEGPERDRVSGALRHRGGLPEDALRDALAGRARLPGLRQRRLLRAQDTQAVSVQPVQEAGAADRRDRVPGHQAAAHRLVRRDLPPRPG